MNTPHVIAACFALAGFAATAVVGVYVGNPATLILPRAMLVMLAAWVVGRVLGGFMAKAVTDHVAQYKQDRPLPDTDPATPEDQANEAVTPTPQPFNA